MQTKLSSNGFGGFLKYLIFSIPEPYATQLHEAGWEVVGERSGRTQFKLNFTGRGKGDDETAVLELCHALPEIVPMNSWRVDWKKSKY